MEFLTNFYNSIAGLLFWIDLLLAMFVIFKERKNPKSTMLWVIVIMTLPLVGFVMYMVTGFDMTKSRIFKSKYDDDKIKIATAKHRIRKINTGTYQYHDKRSYEYDGMIRLLSNNSLSKYTEHNKVKLINDGVEFMNDMIEEFENAEQNIYFQFYIISSGEFFDRLKEIFIRKAIEGVEIKILVDGMGGRKLKKQDIQELEDAGVEVDIFFPPTLGPLNIRLNYRNHRKIVVVDNKVGYLGGFNIGDEYISKDPDLNYWRDSHIKIKGEAVNDLINRFYLDYKFSSKKADGRYQTQIDEFDENYDVAMNIVASGPDHDLEQIRDGFDKMISLAKERIYIQTPYFIPDEGLFKSLIMAAYSGVDIRITVPGRPDHPFVQPASRWYLGRLLEVGASVYYYDDESFIHSKTILIDDFVSSIGTANFDIRSFALNFEINAFIYDYGFNRDLAESFHKDMEVSEKYNLQDYENRSKIDAIKESLCVLLSPLL